MSVIQRPLDLRIFTPKRNHLRHHRPGCIRICWTCEPFSLFFTSGPSGSRQPSLTFVLHQVDPHHPRDQTTIVLDLSTKATKPANDITISGPATTGLCLCRDGTMSDAVLVAFGGMRSPPRGPASSHLPLETTTTMGWKRQ